MLRFHDFEELGLRLTCMSDKSDGDLAGTAEDPDTIRFCDAIGIEPGSLRTVRQVHGNRVLHGDDASNGTEADALITDQPGQVPAIRVADCVPVFLFDPVQRAVGLVHAGWRGTLAGVGPAAIDALGRRFGSNPADIHALLGPSAGVCCYEVSSELAQRFDEAGLVAAGNHVDLPASNRVQLLTAGLRSDFVDSAGVCTICDGRFHSYRADPNAGRNLAVVAL